MYLHANTPALLLAWCLSEEEKKYHVIRLGLWKGSRQLAYFIAGKKTNIPQPSEKFPLGKVSLEGAALIIRTVPIQESTLQRRVAKFQSLLALSERQVSHDVPAIISSIEDMITHGFHNCSFGKIQWESGLHDLRGYIRISNRLRHELKARVASLSNNPPNLTLAQPIRGEDIHSHHYARDRQNVYKLASTCLMPSVRIPGR